MNKKEAHVIGLIILASIGISNLVGLFAVAKDVDRLRGVVNHNADANNNNLDSLNAVDFHLAKSLDKLEDEVRKLKG